MKNFLIFTLFVLIVSLVFSIKHDKEVANSKSKISSFNTITNNNVSKSKISSKDNNGYKYVKPYTTKRGKFVKGHLRKPVSSNRNAYKNRARSRYYYKTHKYIIKERRKKSKK
jgi:hypothetical protein